MTTGIFSTVESQANGNAGNIEIRSRSVSLTQGAEIQSLTRGEGNAGNIQINASDSINLSGVAPTKSTLEEIPKGGFSSGLITSTEGISSGQRGNISINTGDLRLSDGAVLNARTRSAAPGGNITVKANRLEAVNGGQLLTTSFNSGRAGSISIEVADKIILSGSDPTFANRLAQFGPEIVDNDSAASGLFARSVGAGASGDLRIATRQLLIQDGAEVTVSSQSQQAGDLTTKASSIFLDNQGKLTAETTSGNGGNISLQVSKSLQMRRDSQISATAGTANAPGDSGNINIDADLTIANPTENNDITANAFTGSAGRVQITASGIFGLVPRNLAQLKSLLATDDPNQLNPTRLTSSDITAISQANPSLSGQEIINLPDVNLSHGLIQLPVQPVEVKIAQTCTPDSSQSKSEFIITGRGGLPPSPDETLSSDAIQVDWVTLNPKVENRNQDVSTNITTQTPNSIVEATGLTIAHNGDVILTASATTALPANSWHIPAKCHAN